MANSIAYKKYLSWPKHFGCIFINVELLTNGILFQQKNKKKKKKNVQNLCQRHCHGIPSSLDNDKMHLDGIHRRREKRKFFKRKNIIAT